MKDGGGRGERKRRPRRGWQQVENEAEHTGVSGVMKLCWGAAEFTELTPETQGADANAAGAAAGTSCEPRSSPRAAPVAGVPSSGEGRTGDPGTGERPWCPSGGHLPWRAGPEHDSRRDRAVGAFFGPARGQRGACRAPRLQPHPALPRGCAATCPVTLGASLNFSGRFLFIKRGE